MYRRLYFMLPDVTHCKQLVRELVQHGIDEQNIHVVARDDVPLEGVNHVNDLPKTELTRGLELGLSVGGIAGMLGGLLAVTFPPAGIALGGGAVILASTLAGAGFGSLVSALVANDIPNYELEAFAKDIEEGQILLILDISTKEVDNIIRLIKVTHPEAIIGIIKPASMKI